MEEDFFKNRKEAGERLAELLLQYKDDAVLFALPRGGVVVGSVVAEKLNIPLKIIVAKKIGHPFNSEFAIGAITASGMTIGDRAELSGVDQEWLRVEAAKKQAEAKKALEFYTGSSYNQIALYDKIVLMIDDGVATGSTMLAAIEEIRLLRPEKLIVGVPVISKEILMSLKDRVDEVVAVMVPKYFLGAVGAYYDSFEQVDDIEVLKLLKQSKKRYERTED